MDHPRLIRVARALLVAAIAGLAGLALAQGPLRLAPFDRAARGVGPDGSWSVGSAQALYDQPRYLLALSLAHLNAPAPGAASVAAGIGYARASLALQPANPFAWTALARGLRLSGDEAGALVALRHAYRLGPHSVALSLPRVAVGHDLWLRLDAESRQAMLQDFRYIHWRDDPAATRRFLAENPGAAALNRLSRALAP